MRMLVLFLFSFSILVVLFLFKLPVNRVFPIGPLYYIRRDNGTSKDPRACVGFMHEVSHPWRRGKGVQVRLEKHVIQVGFCKKYPNQKDDEGVLSAIGGRYMDTDVKDIRDW